jgi:hypothetical protein
MASKKSKAASQEEQIITAYMSYVLEHEKFPSSVYKFCKQIELTEDVFYKHFGSLESVQKNIWKVFFNNAMALVQKNKDYEQYANKEKMLSFFFTFFEVLTLNRSYVLFTFSEFGFSARGMGQLKGLRRLIKEFASELIEEGNETKAFKISRHNPALFSEGAWLQCLFLLKFWSEDSSPGFEKTDVAIEKSVTTIFDVFDNTPLDSILDFGKFLYKENRA